MHFIPRLRARLFYYFFYAFILRLFIFAVCNYEFIFLRPLCGIYYVNSSYFCKYSPEEKSIFSLGDLRPYFDFNSDADGFRQMRQSGDRFDNFERCSMKRCFNFSRCQNKAFKVHIYHSDELENLLNSSNTESAGAYSKIISSIYRSGYYTSDPDEACIFILAYDTLDRDAISPRRVKDLQKKIDALPTNLWNDGENHLIFNLYAGTYPNYDVTDLGVKTRRAMLAKASFSVRNFRANFDISLPLFHPILPVVAFLNESDLFRPVVSSSIFGKKDIRRRYLFSFKGKRYVYGIGSETRNSLYHLHDGGKESVVLTTCIHGRDWHKVKDERCDEDNSLYERWSYDSLLSQSDFCLVPRGRRLGSYRFLEALRYGCVPTLLANEWELPFSEIIPWSEGTIWADERLMALVRDALQSVSTARTFMLRSKAKELSQTYFSSVHKIVETTLEIIKSRLQPWQSPLFRNSATFQRDLSELEQFPLFDAYIIARSKQSAMLVRRLLDSVVSSTFCSSITVLCFGCTLHKKSWRLPVTIINLANSSWPKLETDASIGSRKSAGIFWFDPFSPAAALSTDEIDFAVQVWRWFPKRLVGYYSRRYQQNDYGDSTLTSKLLNDFNFLTSSAILYHKAYNDYLNEALASLPSIGMKLACFDRLLNYYSTTLDAGAPLKLSARIDMLNGQSDFYNFTNMNMDCFNNNFGANYVMQRPSRVRFDPLLYKDPVSNMRKKYKKMEFSFSSN